MVTKTIKMITKKKFCDYIFAHNQFNKVKPKIFEK